MVKRSRSNARAAGCILHAVIAESYAGGAAIPYELAWGEVDCAEDLLVHQEAGASGVSK